MRRCLLALPISIALISFVSVSAWATPGVVNVSVTLPGALRQPLPFTLAFDSENRQYTADANGSLDLRSARPPVRVFLDSPMFHIATPEREFFEVTLSENDLASERDVVFGTEVPASARICRTSLEFAHGAVLRQIIAAGLVVPRQLLAPVTCLVETEEGCQATRSDNTLYFSKGSSVCNNPGENPALIFHEFGHVVADSLIRSSVVPGQDVGEAVADLTAAFLTGRSRFAEGFWKNRQISWLRDLALPKGYPKGFRGTYTGSLILSSAWWEIAAKLGTDEAFRRLLQALPGVRIRPGMPFQPATVAEAALKVVAKTPDRCTFQSVFYAHGLVKSLSGCAPTNALPAPQPSCSITRTDRISLIEPFQPLQIPDALANQEHLLEREGDWVAMPYKLDIRSSEQIVAATLVIQINHPYPDDVLIGWANSTGKIREFFKGEEEIAIPKRLSLPVDDFPAQGAIVVRDVGPMLTGEITSAAIEVVIGSGCGAGK